MRSKNKAVTSKIQDARYDAGERQLEMNARGGYDRVEDYAQSGARDMYGREDYANKGYNGWKYYEINNR